MLAAYLKGNNPREAVVKELEADIASARRELDESKPLADLLSLEKKIFKQHEDNCVKTSAESATAWALVPKAAEAARQKDVIHNEAIQAREESRARIAELARTVGQPAPPTQLQDAVATAENLRLQLSALPTHHAEKLGDVASLLATLQATVSAAAAPVPQADAQPADEDASMGNAQHTTETEPAGAAVPSGNAAPAVPAAAEATGAKAEEPAASAEPTAAATVVEAPASSPAVLGNDQQAAALSTTKEPEFSATQEDTALVKQANDLCLAVQYDSAPLAEARAALGARLAFPPLDFESIKRGIQQVQEAVATQAEADDVPPQNKSQRPEPEA